MTATDVDAGFRDLRAEIQALVRRRVRDADAADDLIQDVMAKAAASGVLPGPDGHLRRFARCVARNAIVDHYRRRRAPAEAVDAVQAPPATDELARRGLFASLRRFLDELPAEQRVAVVLTEIDGLSQHEVARRLGVPASTIKSRVQRGRRRLEAALRACCAFEFDRRGGLVDWQRHVGGACRDC